MSLFDILLLAVALSIDAVVVSFSNGLIFKQKRTVKSLSLASAVGFFQFLMPIIGFYFAHTVSTYVKPYSHWVVFVIFTFLGVKFIVDASEQGEKNSHNFDWKYIFTVGFATSIDALFAGVSILFSGINILIPALIIGFVTFINALLAFWVANLLKNFSTKSLEVLGGMILILLGFKVLFTAIL